MTHARDKTLIGLHTSGDCNFKVQSYMHTGDCKFTFETNLFSIIEQFVF